jgi:hypothetical protein
MKKPLTISEALYYGVIASALVYFVCRVVFTFLTF